MVGIGASAGGPGALERFFARVPDSSGLAYIVVQHLDPNHPALLCELLQRVTPMRVQAPAGGRARRRRGASGLRIALEQGKRRAKNGPRVCRP